MGQELNLEKHLNVHKQKQYNINIKSHTVCDQSDNIKAISKPKVTILIV